MNNALLRRTASTLVEYAHGVRLANGTTAPKLKLAQAKLTAFVEGAHLALNALEAKVSPAPFGLELDVLEAFQIADDRFAGGQHPTYAQWKVVAVDHLVDAWTPTEDDVKLREHFARRAGVAR